MNYKKSFSIIILCLMTVSISAQLKVDSIGDVIINKSLKFNQNSSSQFHYYENNTLWSANNGGIKIHETGKFIISPNDQGGNNIIDTSVKYSFDPPYVHIHPSCMNAALFIKTGASRPLHTLLGPSYGGSGEGIRSDVSAPSHMPYVAYYADMNNEMNGNFYSMKIFSVDASGTVYAANGFSQLSDGSTKENVNNLTTSLDKINLLRPITFRYKSNNSKKSTIDKDLELYASNEIKNKINAEKNYNRIGFIAQEVESILPEVVRTLPDGKKSIMYSDLIPLLTQGIQDLHNEIINLQQRISDLESELIESENKIPTQARVAKQNNTNNELQSDNALLYINTPNPFKNETKVKYYIPENSASSSLHIYDLQGKQIKQIAINTSGHGEAIVKGSELRPGMYIYALIVDGNEIDNKKMIITE